MQLAMNPLTAQSRLEIAFWNYHNAHPEVYALLRGFAREWRRAKGFDAVVGISALWERMRWDVEMQYYGLDYKLNNSHRAYYARLLMEREPDLDGIFRLRQQRVGATFGPDKEEA